MIILVGLLLMLVIILAASNIGLEYAFEQLKKQNNILVEENKRLRRDSFLTLGENELSEIERHFLMLGDWD